MLNWFYLFCNTYFYSGLHSSLTVSVIRLRVPMLSRTINDEVVYAIRLTLYGFTLRKLNINH